MGLVDLPVELRLLIYEFVYQEDPLLLEGDDGEWLETPHHALFQTCRMIRGESKGTLRLRVTERWVYNLWVEKNYLVQFDWSLRKLEELLKIRPLVPIQIEYERHEEDTIDKFTISTGAAGIIVDVTNGDRSIFSGIIQAYRSHGLEVRSEEQSRWLVG